KGHRPYFDSMLRWTLHNRVDKNPSVSVPLLRVLIKELEKAERIDSKIRIIPLLHTLVYTVLQVRFLSVFIPEDLYRRMYFCLKSLVRLPVPYCAIALYYARQMKMEQNAPGNIYSYIKAIKVFLVLIFMCFLALFIRIKLGCFPCIKVNVKLEFWKLELHFQDLVTILEQRTEDGASDDNQYKTRLQEIYQDILTAPKASQVETQLPSPEVSFHVWTKEDEIWNELVNFALMVPADRNSACLDEDDLKRNSVMSTISTDSGIEGDMLISELSSIMLESQGGAELPEEQSSSHSFYRRQCVRCPKAGNRMTLMMEAIRGNGGYSLAKEERNLTARILVMGDDRTLGRLAKTLHTIRCITFHFPLKKKTPAMTSHCNACASQEGAPEDMLTLAGYLGSVDPWYDCNINGLGAMILKLAQMVIITLLKSPQYEWELFNIISYYTRVSQHPVHLPIYSVKVRLNLPMIIFLSYANIRVLEEQTFTVCLDKDPRKTFKNVQSIEVSPCLDPGYSHQPSTKSKYSLGEGGEPLGKYVNRTITLPINTFCGIEQ
uniref:Phosphoinositide-3-kinase, regulatory subunit 6b n=1 Tax=Sinocyclocheilus grahami TaxID=75366 RepID=A0A672RB41_SINGR